MGTPGLSPDILRETLEAYRKHGENKAAAARALEVDRNTFRHRLNVALREEISAPEAMNTYDLARPEMTPLEAWEEHASTFERTASSALRSQWRVIERPKGPFVIFHSTDEHIDDDATPLKLIEHDIKRAHDLNSIMCHGGDALNNWPLGGRLAKKWATQDCTMPKALLRLRHFIDLFRPHVWTDGNHEEMNAYLSDYIKQELGQGVIQDYWTVNFIVRIPGMSDFKAIMSHKFQKGRSWFHPHHGVIREMLEGEEANLYMEGHLHISGALSRFLPERGIESLSVSSAGYKVCDEYAARISRGGKMPKLKGRAHWIVCDDQAEKWQKRSFAYDCPDQAEVHLNGMQNLRQI